LVGPAFPCLSDIHYLYNYIYNIIYMVGGLEQFGTYFSFSIYWEFHHPNGRTHIFQRG
jgi:hypothetical protein